MRLHLVTTLAALAPACLATFDDEAYKVDAQLSLLGLPQSENTFFAQPYTGSKASLVYTLSEKCVLGAVNPKDGAIVWRQQLKSHEECVAGGLLRAGGDQDTLVEASEGTVRAWSAADGRLAWERVFGPALSVADVQIPELAGGAEAKEKDVLVVLVGQRGYVQRLDGKTGKTKWAFLDEEDEPYMISPSGDLLYYISLHSSGKSGSIKVTSLDLTTGEQGSQVSLASGNEISEGDIILAGANSAAPIIVWTDISNPRQLKMNILGTKQTATFDIKQTDSKVEGINILAPERFNAASHFLVHFQTAKGHWAEVYHIDISTSKIEKAYDLPLLGGQGAFALSAVDTNIYFTRFTDSEVTLFSSASHGILQRWPLNIKDLPALETVYPVHASSEVAARSGTPNAVRSAVLFSSGDWAMIRNGDLSWSRPESLAGIVTAQWANTRIQDTLVQELKVEGQSNPVSAYIHRVNRHVQDLTSLPSFGQTLLKKFLAGGETELSDSFGFKKLIVAATDNGRVIAIEAGNQLKVAWNIEAKATAEGESWSSISLGSVKNRLSDETISSTLDFIEAEEVLGARTTYELKDGSLQGTNGDSTIWTFSPRPGQAFTAVTPQHPNEPIASIGKALADRSVLYKYLNPNAVVVTAVDHTINTATIYLVDASTGALLHTSEHTSVDTSRPIAAAITENWFAYTLVTFASTSTLSAGPLLVISELYESPSADSRGPLSHLTNYSALATSSPPHIISATFHLPVEISLLGVTQTAQGITSRNLLAYAPSISALLAIPRHAIDPRRTVASDPTPAQAAEEHLSRYTPFLDIDPKWHLTHKRDVLGVRRIFATPAGLESTSLVVAWGLDVFATRVAPSGVFDVLGGTFNKVTLTGTVVALAGAAFACAPVVQRKMTNALWGGV